MSEAHIYLFICVMSMFKWHWMKSETLSLSFDDIELKTNNETNKSISIGVTHCYFIMYTCSPLQSNGSSLVHFGM